MRVIGWIPEALMFDISKALFLSYLLFAAILPEASWAQAVEQTCTTNLSCRTLKKPNTNILSRPVTGHLVPVSDAKSHDTESVVAASIPSENAVGGITPSSSEPTKSATASALVVMVRTAVKVVEQPIALDATEGFERKISEKEIETSAGTFGDPSRFMQMLPGVVSDKDQYNDFIVRGGNPDENQFIVDNIEVPSINQLALSDTTGGFVSMIDNAAVQSMTLHIDAYDSKYDQRLSSIVEISTRPTGRVARKSESEIGIAGAGGYTSLPLGGDGSMFVSARRSILNLLTDDIGLNGVPIYTNALIRADGSVDEQNSWWGLSLTGIDSIKIHPSPTDDWETNPYDINYHGWRNTTGINWQHIYSTKLFGVLSLSNSLQSQSILENAQLLNNATIYSEDTSDGVSTLKYDGTFQATSWLTITAGLRGSVDRLNYNVDQPLGLQNPYSEDPAPMNPLSLNRRFATASFAEYSQAALLLPYGMKVVAGERLSQWAIVGSKVWTPKLLFMTPLLGRMVHAGYAEYAQLPPSLYLLAFANQETLVPIHSRQFTAGVDLVRTRRVEMSMESYKKTYLDYPVAQDYPQLSLANVADTFGQAFLLFPMTSKGKGLAEGAELSLRLKPSSRITLTTATTYSRSWYSGLDGVLRRGNYDLPFVANVAGTLLIRKRIIVSVRYGDTSGRPYTPDNEALSRAQERDVYDLSTINSLRGNPYHRLDFRVEQSIPISRGVLTWHLGLENALGASNFYAYQWRPRAGGAGVLAQDQMPRFPDGGIKLTF
jgi:hypothetical protein